MSGDSGGSSNKKKPKKEEPVIPGTGPMMTQPAFMGDNQNLLAQQLAAGGFGSQPDIMQMLTQTFTPMQVLDTRPPPPAPAPTPVTPTPKPPKQNRPGRDDDNGPARRRSSPNSWAYRPYGGGRD